MMAELLLGLSMITEMKESTSCQSPWWWQSSLLGSPWSWEGRLRSLTHLVRKNRQTADLHDDGRDPSWAGHGNEVDKRLTFLLKKATSGWSLWWWQSSILNSPIGFKKKVFSIAHLEFTCYWCERCLLITESSKTPGHYRYLIWVLVYIPYTGLAVFSFAISRVPVYTAISNFFQVRVLNASE